MMDRDPWAEEDLPAAETLVDEVEDAELFLYPGSAHPFADSSLDDYDEQSAGQGAHDRLPESGRLVRLPLASVVPALL
jgi:hypothetical protein